MATATTSMPRLQYSGECPPSFVRAIKGAFRRVWQAPHKYLSRSTHRTLKLHARGRVDNAAALDAFGDLMFNAVDELIPADIVERWWMECYLLFRSQNRSFRIEFRTQEYVKTPGGRMLRSRHRFDGKPLLFSKHAAQRFLERLTARKRFTEMVDLDNLRDGCRGRLESTPRGFRLWWPIDRPEYQRLAKAIAPKASEIAVGTLPTIDTADGSIVVKTFLTPCCRGTVEYQRIRHAEGSLVADELSAQCQEHLRLAALSGHQDHAIELMRRLHAVMPQFA